MKMPVVLLCAGLIAGCAAKPKAPANPGPPPPSFAARTNRNAIVTPGHIMTGRVAAVNAAGRFVVLTFPLGIMPSLEKRLSIYRGGLKTGEVRVTGPQLDINIDADLVVGECHIGDEVRED